MSQYIELENILIQILNKNDKSTIKSTENVISFSDPSLSENSTKDFFKVDLKKTVDTSDQPKCWYNWLTDYTLKEYLRKIDDKVTITEIDLTGNDFITDQGIIWMIDNLKKKKNLTRIILRACSQLTEVSLNFLLHNVSINVLIDMSFTNVKYISPECVKYCNVNLSNCLLEYTSFNGQLKPMAPHSIIIWPSKSVDFSGLNLFGDSKVSSNSSTYFDHLLDVRIGDNIPLFNIFNYKFTEVPVHMFVPKNPGQVLILLSDKKEEAYNHLIETLIYFLSSTLSTISSPKFILPTGSPLSLSDDRIEYKMPIQKLKYPPSKPMIQKKAVSQKMSKQDYDLENEDISRLPNPLLEHSNFGYKNVAIKGKTIKHLHDTGYWVSKIPIDKFHTVFGIKSSNSTKLSNIAFGFSVFNKNIWKTLYPENDALLIYNISEQFIQYNKGNTKDTYQMKHINSCISASIKCDLKQSATIPNERNLFVSLEVDEKLCWSFVFKVNNTDNIVPFLIINQSNCSIELSEDWNIVDVSDIKEKLKLEKSELQNSLNFVTICYGENCQEVFNEIDEFDWSERLSAPMIKLETFISTITEKDPNLIDFNDCLKLSEATRQLEQIQNFISDHKKRLKLFKIEKDDKKVLEEILSHVGKNVLQDAELFPHKFSPNSLEHKCQCIMNLSKPYVTIDQVISLNIIDNPNTASDVFQKIFTEARGIYIKKFGLLILNILWFDSFLKEIITNIPFESNYRLLGLHSGAKVWTQISLVNVLNNFKVETTDIVIWKEFLIYLGILIPLPCIRHCSSDELFLFVNPMTEGTGKKSHLNSLMKNSETYPEKLEAKVKYEKICQDIYSFYPQLLAKIVSIGQVQLMSPVATVLHITGGVELLIESGEDHITLSAYLPSPLIGNSSQKFSLVEYLWSILYLCIDAFDELLINQNILTLQTFCTSRDTLKNYSICYNHNWYSDGLYNNICSLCGNCSSSDGMNCPYNRINSERRGICLCLRHSRTCVDCGICPSCAQLHWTNHCESDPCRLMFFDSNGIMIPKTPINPHLSTTFSINIFQDGSDVFFGMGSNKSTFKIDVFGFTNTNSPKTATATDNTLPVPSNVNVSTLSFMISEISMYKPNLYHFSNCSGINVIQELGILTYECETKVGIVVGRLPVSKERNRFSIEILNPGQLGRITIGLVNDKYPPGQPGWYPVSLAYHGDDGGIFLGQSSAVKCLETFSEIGNKIEVEIEFPSSKEDSLNIKRSLTWYKNGREIEKVYINSDTDLYPAIGMHSQGEQIKLLDTLVWQDYELSKNPEDILVETADDISVSPTNIILLTEDEIWFATINIVPRKKTIKNLNFQIIQRNQSSETIHWNIKSLNKLSSKSEKQQNWSFDNIPETSEMFLSFRLTASGHDDFSKWSLRLTLSTVDGIEKLIKWNFTKDSINMRINGQSDPYVFEVPDQFAIPNYPSFLLTTISSSFNSSNSEVSSFSKSEKVFEKKYYHIPRAEYHLIFKANRRDAWIKCSSFIKPTYTKSFQIGNMITFDSKPSMVVNVDKTANQLSIIGVSEKISFNNKKLQPFMKSGKQLLSMKLSQDEKFKNVVLINKSLLTAPPPSRPWILLFQETQNIRFSDLYFTKSCNVYHGISICLLNFLCSSQEELHEWEIPCDVIALPFNQKDKDPSHFLFEHSFMDLIDWKKFLFYPFCKGKSPLYDSRLHLVDVQGVEPFDPHINGADAYRTLFSNPSLLECHRLLLNHKIYLPKTEKLFPKATHKFSEDQVEFLITCILEKVTGFMLLNNLLCVKKDEYNEVINIDLNNIFEADNDRSLIKVNATEVCCRLHTTNFTENDLDYLNNIQEIAVDNNNSNNNIGNVKKNNSNLASHPNFIYAKLAQSVIFSGKTMKNIPEELFRLFKNLKSLELRNMVELENLPSSIYHLKGLQRLVINLVKLHTFPDVWKFPNLRYLEITRCPISSINEGTGCNQLQTVKLSSLPLKTFPVFLCNVENLVSLEIQLHGLERLPSEFTKLKSLKELHIYGSPLFYDMIKNEQLKTHLNVEFGYPEINIYNTVSKTNTGFDFLSVGETFVNVPRIGSGYSTSADTLNQGGFPSVILQLHQLTSLTIRYQSIRFIPKEIQNLEKLESLDLSLNPLLEKIPGEISLIKSMKQLTLLHCPSLTVPPQEIISRGSSASLAYLKYLLSKNITCNRTKLMFVGLGEAGKTSLLHALMSQDNCAKEIIESSTKIVTDGIDITKWTVDYQNETIQYSTWDFAGQDVYYNTHQFFLSPKAIYIVVWSVRQGIEHGDLEFWLSSIFCHAKDAPIFVVGTRCNQVKADESCFYSLKQRYPQVVDFKLVDSLTGTGIKELKQSLVEVTLRLPYIRQPIPSTILDLENKLIKERSKTNFMTFKEFETTALAEGIIIKDIKNVTQILHDFSSIQYFDTEILKDFVVINPQWIVDIMSKVVSIVNAKIENGVFYHENMKDVWNEFDSSLHSWMLSLTEEFDLTYPHPTIENANIVPCLLSEEEPHIEWPKDSEIDNWNYYYINYKFEFLPAGLFNRIQVRLLDFTEPKSVWKLGMYFQKNKHYVLFKREKKNWLTLKAIGVRPTNVLAMIDDIIKGLTKIFFHGIQYDLEISCPDCIENLKNFDNVEQFDWNKIAMISSKVIKKAVDKKIEYLQCPELHLNSMKSIKENTPETASAEEFIEDLLSKIQTAISLYASVDKMVTIIHSKTDFNEKSILSLPDIDKILNELNIQSCKITSPRDAAWKTSISKCSACLIILTDQLAKDKEMNDICNYIHVLKKKFILVIISTDKMIQQMWKCSPFFMTVHIRFSTTDEKIKKAKQTELTSALKQCVFGFMKEEDNTGPYECFFSYCWANSFDAVNKGTKLISGAILCPEADPRRLCKFLKDNGIKCWIDESDMKMNAGLNKQLSTNLQNSKLMIAFISKEYDESENCMMELNFMVNILKKPVIFVIIGTKFLMSEVGLIIQKKEKPTVLDFSNKLLVSESDLLNTVKETLTTIVDTPISRETEVKLQNRSHAFIEHIELLSRQLLNHLSFLITDHCPRLVIADLQESNEPFSYQKFSNEQSFLFNNLCLKTICETEGDWHVMNEIYYVPLQESYNLIENCAAYLYLIYTVLEYRNPGLKCLETNDIQSVEFIRKIKQIASQSNLNFEQSYLNLMKFYLSMNPVLSMHSLTRYRLASGRDLWICDIHASQYPRCKRIEKDAVQRDSVIVPVNEVDMMVLGEIKSKSEEEIKKYSESFRTVVESCQIPKISECDQNDSINYSLPPLKRLLRSDTTLGGDKEIVTNQHETYATPIRPNSSQKVHKKEINLQVPKTKENKNRQNLMGSRVCTIQ